MPNNPAIGVPALGRRWTLWNDSTRPDDEVKTMLAWVLEQTRGLSARGAVRVLDTARNGHRDGFTGEAGDRRKGHAMPKWAGRSRYKMRLSIASDEFVLYGHPIVCWHSSLAKKTYDAGGFSALHAELDALWAAGDTKWGEWPIYVVNDWREVFIHLAAHEAAHLIEYDRERKGSSEVFCEQFAIRVLTTWREENRD